MTILLTFFSLSSLSQTSFSCQDDYTVLPSIEPYNISSIASRNNSDVYDCAALCSKSNLCSGFSINDLGCSLFNDVNLFIYSSDSVYYMASFDKCDDQVFYLSIVCIVLGIIIFGFLFSCIFGKEKTERIGYQYIN